MNETVTVTDVLLGNIGKLENIRIPVKEVAAINAINEVVHDLRVCVDAIMADAQAQQEAKNQQPQEQEEPKDDADAQ